MKVTVVPAQVTTVEDRIAGNLSMPQMMLLAIPIFGGSALFAILPPFMGGAPYKYVLLGILALVSSVLAIRVKGKVLLFLLIVLLRYNLRPKYYLSDKRTLAGREIIEPVKEEKEVTTQEVKQEKVVIPNLSTTDAARVLSLIDNPAATVRFETNKKGGLYVRITQIKE